VDTARDDSVQVILGAIGTFWAKWGLKRAAQVFLRGKSSDFSATWQRPIFTKFGHETYFRCPVEENGKTFSKILICTKI